MRCAALFALVAVSTAVSPLRAFGQNGFPTHADGYENKPNASDVEQKAPPGYVGMTEVYSSHSVGNQPATVDNSYDTHVTMSNLVQDCPLADGTVEGRGELTAGADYKFVHAGVTNFVHVNTSAKGKYNGTVGDDARLKDPVLAEVDYVFDESGSTRRQNGAMTTSPPTHVSQHLTMQVHAILNKPDLTLVGYSGGDPNSIHFERSLGMGTAITFFGGIFYAMAETNWVQADNCAKIVFDPPSRSRMPVLGSDVKVNGSITTKGGAGVRGSFVLLQPLVGGGSVSAVDESTDPGSAAIFTYTAPNTKVDSAGFAASALSRAGTANAKWVTALGTDWSGQISVSRVIDGDAGQSDLQTWSSSEAMRITIDVKDGIGKATGYAEHHYMGENRHNVANNGSVHVEFDDGSTADATSSGTSTAPVTVTLDSVGGNYSISAGYGPFPDGRETRTSCMRDKCTSHDHPFHMEAILPSIGGKLSDLNHLSGSQSEVHHGLGRSRKGTSTFTLTWDLARRGTTQ